MEIFCYFSKYQTDEKNSLSFYLLVFSLFPLVTGCDKHYAKKLAGTYTCKIRATLTSATLPSTDTTYYGELEVSQDSKNIIILDNTVHIDSLRNEKIYTTGGYPKYFQAQFKNDSLFVIHKSGGQGAQVSSWYAGRRK